MSSQNTITGRGGEHDVGGTAVARLTQWALSGGLSGTNEWGDSDSAGYTARSPQRFDRTFTTEGKYDSTDEFFDLFREGDNVRSTLWFRNVAGLYYDFPRSLCMGYDITIDVDTEEVVGWSASWGNDGIYYYPGQAGAAARVYP